MIRNNVSFNNFISDLFNLGNSDCPLLIGLVLAYNISLIVDFFLLAFFLKRKIGSFDLKEFFNYVLKLLTSCLPLIAIALVVMNFFKVETLFPSLIEFTIITLTSFLIYFLFTLLFKVEGAETIKNKLTKILNKGN